MTIINIEVPAIPNNVGHLDIEISTDKITWQSIPTPDVGSQVTQVNVDADLTSPGVKLYARLVATRGGAILRTMKIIYS